MSVSAVITRLRAELSTVRVTTVERCAALPFGVPAVDAVLAGGLRLDALHEVAAITPGLENDAATTLFIAALAARTWGPVLWVTRGKDMFAPDAAQVGLCDDRVIHIEAPSDADAVALMEEGLRHRSLGAVIGDMTRAGPVAMRRLQQAASGGNTIALLHRRTRRGTTDPLPSTSAAATQWRVGVIRAAAAGRRARWRVELVGQGGGWTLVAPDDFGRCALPVVRAERRESVEPMDWAA